MTSAAYQVRLKSHLARYRSKRLGVCAEGIWKKTGKEYPHILPEELLRLNICEPIRAEFWAYLAGHPEVGLHEDFHHLNSSQAMCFNLFFPLLGLGDSPPDVLGDVLGLPPAAVTEWAFEHVEDPAENTHFDLFFTCESGMRVFVEAKLSERRFEPAEPDERHLRKLREIYAPMLSGKIDPRFLEPPAFFESYQIFRNIGYADVQGSRQVCFVVPRANEALAGELDLLGDALADAVRSAVHVVWLEDLLDRIDGRALSGVVAGHYALFREKYFVKESGCGPECA